MKKYSVADHPHQGLRADRRGEDRDPDQGRQHRLEDALRSPGTLLTWPETVQERFQKWGRKWPENVDAGKVTLAQVDYIAAYKDYVDMVYKTFKPFDYETGEGIVVAPPKEVLLRPAVFSDETCAWPRQDLVCPGASLDSADAAGGRRAGEQERQGLEFRDHPPDRSDRGRQSRSPRISARSPRMKSWRKPRRSSRPAKPRRPPTRPRAAVAVRPMAGMGRKAWRGMMGMGGGGGARQDPESVYYVKAGNDQQYRILPVQMTVLIDQDHVQDLLVELENSPMSIQVKDFELQRPTARVVKPEKGTQPARDWAAE